MRKVWGTQGAKRSCRGGERGSTAAAPLARVVQYLDGTGKSSTHKWKSLKAGTGETGRRWARNLTRVWRKRVLPELCGLLGRAWWVLQRSFLNSGARCRGAAVFHVAEKRKGVCAAPKWEPGARNRKAEPVEVCAPAWFRGGSPRERASVQRYSEDYFSSW